MGARPPSKHESATLGPAKSRIQHGGGWNSENLARREESERKRRISKEKGKRGAVVATQRAELAPTRAKRTSAAWTTPWVAWGASWERAPRRGRWGKNTHLIFSDVLLFKCEILEFNILRNATRRSEIMTIRFNIFLCILHFIRLMRGYSFEHTQPQKSNPSPSKVPPHFRRN